MNMGPLATPSGGDLSSIELLGDGVVARVSGRLNFPDDRQHIRRKLTRLGPQGLVHEFYSPFGRLECLTASRAP